ncbi:MAG TPA: alpha/beta hydrolase [Sphingomicrobium sp.]|nr:alpha/beta hydrolase [Sphingomicrobium sp.]
MVRQLAASEPETARKALQGLAFYETAARGPGREPRPVAAEHKGVAIRDCGGAGPPAILVPSLINPPSVLDLDREVSLAQAIAAMGRRALLLDWGEASARSELDIAGHVDHRLVPLLERIGEPAALVGYCLGGTMAIAAANLVPVERVATLAAPWAFSGYPDEARSALLALWRAAGPAAQSLHALPMEVLQSAFWSLDPRRTVAKFARLAELDPASPEARRFVALEDWANHGEPLPLPAARELIEDLFAADFPGGGRWRVGGRPISDALDVPVVHCTATNDRITPAATAARGERRQFPAGHVGMVVGSARRELHAALKGFLTPCR